MPDRRKYSWMPSTPKQSKPVFIPSFFTFIKDRFESQQIWSRGSSYTSKVKNCKLVDSDLYMATVQGSPQYGGYSNYEVKISRGSGKYNAQCTCPFNRNGKSNYCKHISGVLRYMQLNFLDFEKGDDDNIIDVVEVADYKTHPLFQTIAEYRQLITQNIPFDYIVQLIQGVYKSLGVELGADDPMMKLVKDFLSKYDVEYSTYASKESDSKPKQNSIISRLTQILTNQTSGTWQNPDSQFFIKYNISSYGQDLILEILKVNKKNQKYTRLDLTSVYQRYQNDNCDYLTASDAEFIGKYFRDPRAYNFFISSKITTGKFSALLQEINPTGKLLLFENKLEYINHAKIVPIINQESGQYIVKSGIQIGDQEPIPIQDQNRILFGNESPYFLIDKTNSTIYKLYNQESLYDLDFMIKLDNHIELEEIQELAKIVPNSKINLPEEFKIQSIKVDSITPQLYLSENEGLLEFEIAFLYLGHAISANSSQDRIEIEQDGKTVFVERNNALEKIHKNSLQTKINNEFASDFILQNINHVSGEEAILFMTEVVDSLGNMEERNEYSSWQVLGQENLKLHNFVKPKIKFDLSSGIDWLSLSADLSIDGQSIDMNEIAKLIRKNKRFIDLKNGKKAVLPSDWLTKHKELFELGEIDDNGKLKISKWHLSLLQDFATVANDGKNKLAWQKQIKNTFNITKIQKLNKPELNAQLRPYQQAGYEWLDFMYQNNLGGILADDMGLGKTLQAIALLNKIYSQPPIISTKKTKSKASSKTPPTLVILPKTLITNWQIELTKFAPNLTFEVMHGANRKKDNWSNVSSNIVLTTYYTALKDVQEIKEQTWQLMLLDESQQIKNPDSLIYKALRTIPAAHKLALSGTPVENSLEDLWSQMSFLNPGILGAREWFRAKFLLPIQKNKDEAQAKKLKAIAYPFILRRLKQDVAKELGDKVENTLYVEMDKAQKSLYDGVRLAFKKQIEEEFDNSAFKAKFKVLEGLTKLRQICCDPRLLDSTTNAQSAKLELMLEQLEDVIKEGHKVLIFSQFTSMLALIKPELDKRGIVYSYLDGKTNHRQKAVDEFNDDPNIPVFLISIKAGGVGLNLTSADYVFIFDPWWNPAVESQAVDRSHRIGQKKTVFVYRFVVKDSVEEKILELQASKKDLVKNIITVDESLMKKLDKKDIVKLFG